MRDAYVQMGKAMTYGELDILSMQFGAFLQSSCGLKKGDRVAVMMPNTLQYPIAIHGALRAGFTVVNTNPLYTARELEHQLSDSGATVIVIVENFAHVLQEVIAHTPIKHVVHHQRRRDARVSQGQHRRLRRAPQAQAGEAVQPARRQASSSRR